MLTITPFLLFDGNCAEAMSFYHSCFGGKLSLAKLGDTPMKTQFPPEKHDRIINAHLEAGSIAISATDWMASPQLEPVKGNTMSIFLTAGSAAELGEIFNQLAAGADRDPKTFMELRAVPFGTYGQFTDKFGVGWVFQSKDKPQ